MVSTRLLKRRDVLAADAIGGLVVFLVALPLCLGVAVASDAPPIAGVLAGIVGGVVVGLISRSHTSVSGPAAGLTAVVAAEIAHLGFEAFLLSVVIAGFIQIALGLMRAGFLSAFVPNSVIKGLLAAIGVILILKQIPHLLGHDTDPEGEMSFRQPDHENTFSELLELLGDVHPGAIVIGVVGVALLLVWDRVKWLKQSGIPGPLVVVLVGVIISELLRPLGSSWAISGNHLVSIPVADSITGFTQFLKLPGFTQVINPDVYLAGITIALVASLETLLNLEAVDKIDPQQRHSPPSRELFAQGVGNVIAGLIGGIPVTSVIVRSSVNTSSGSKTKLATIFHGVLLLVAAVLVPTWINRIPLSALAAILIVTGFKLANPRLFTEMWREGKYNFMPFLATVLAIVFTDLLIGILIGLAISVGFILYSNLRRPIRKIVERHLGGDVLRIELASQVSFLNRAALERVLMEVPRGGNVLLDARNTVYIDPDVLSLIHDFTQHVAPAHGVQVSLLGFHSRYELHDRVLFVDYCSQDLRSQMTPLQVLQVLRDGNQRFRNGEQLTRDFHRQRQATTAGQHPMAVVLSCIDSRNPSELVFDLGLGDIFSVRIAGNVISPKVLGSLEYGCAAAGAKVLLVMGHTRCGAVTESVSRLLAPISPRTEVCTHLESIVEDIQHAVDQRLLEELSIAGPERQIELINRVARRNVALVMDNILQQSSILHKLVEQGEIAIVGAMYDVTSGQIDMFPHLLTQLDANDLECAIR
ncbi:MAG: bifunctional SulP family inorganic anion transporter/carbonic anhydrase [Planctomycetaceae bacterium]|nr:bifunctional SulP family inorganic anion transporter/carbonic anhydrase [Planctomycetaceae bacterium]